MYTTQSSPQDRVPIRDGTQLFKCLFEEMEMMMDNRHMARRTLDWMLFHFSIISKDDRLKYCFNQEERYKILGVDNLEELMNELDDTDGLTSVERGQLLHYIQAFEQRGEYWGDKKQFWD